MRLSLFAFSLLLSLPCWGGLDGRACALTFASISSVLGERFVEVEGSEHWPEAWKKRRWGVRWYVPGDVWKNSIYAPFEGLYTRASFNEFHSKTYASIDKVYGQSTALDAHLWESGLEQERGSRERVLMVEASHRPGGKSHERGYVATARLVDATRTSSGSTLLRSDIPPVLLSLRAMSGWKGAGDPHPNTTRLWRGSSPEGYRVYELGRWFIADQVGGMDIDPFLRTLARYAMESWALNQFEGLRESDFVIGHFVSPKVREHFIKHYGFEREPLDVVQVLPEYGQEPHTIQWASVGRLCEAFRRKLQETERELQKLMPADWPGPVPPLQR